MTLHPRQLNTVTRRLSTLAILLAAFLFCLITTATPPGLKDAPSQNVEAGNTLMEAWLIFRQDLDTLSHGQMHPQLLDNLFSQAPIFLVQDASRLANSPGVVVAATRRLAASKTDLNRQLLANLHRDRPEGELGIVLWSRRIEAGDQSARDLALADLSNPNPLVRLKAARVLASARDNRGNAELLTFLEMEPRLSDQAALALGEYGSDAEEKALTRALRSRPDQLSLAAAIGHLRLRKSFPSHQMAIVRRDPAGLRFSGSKSLYTVWFEAAYRATESGADSSAEMLKGIEKVRHDGRKGDGGEVLRRQLKSMIGFWEDVDLIVKNRSGSPAWPTSYVEALSWLRWDNHRKTDPTTLTRRVAAAVSLCSWASRKVAHEKMFKPGQGLTVITPGGGLVGDHNLATSWRGVTGGSVVLDLIEPAKVSSLRFAQSCGDADAARIGEVTIMGSGEGRDWSVTRKLDPKSRYFQQVKLPGKHTRRMKIKLDKLVGDGPACIGELRVE